jgi:hypothetical protein
MKNVEFIFTSLILIVLVMYSTCNSGGGGAVEVVPHEIIYKNETCNDGVIVDNDEECYIHTNEEYACCALVMDDGTGDTAETGHTSASTTESTTTEHHLRYLSSTATTDTHTTTATATADSTATTTPTDSHTTTATTDSHTASTTPTDSHTTTATTDSHSTTSTTDSHGTATTDSHGTTVSTHGDTVTTGSHKYKCVRVKREFEFATTYMHKILLDEHVQDANLHCVMERAKTCGPANPTYVEDCYLNGLFHENSCCFMTSAFESNTCVLAWEYMHQNITNVLGHNIYCSSCYIPNIYYLIWIVIFFI